MFNNALLKEKVSESMAAVLPITGIVLVLSVLAVPLTPGALVLFLFGAVLLVVGMGLFTLGAEISMMPMGEGMGAYISRRKRKWIPLVFCLVLGVVITMAEPDLQVLANQVPAIPNQVLILTVAVGVGIFLMISQLRMFLRIPLCYLLLLFYGIVFILTFLVSPDFVPVSFDSGGVTTGPITVPFIMALGIGMASVRSDRNSESDSFGLIALCSIGPILAVLLLSVVFKPDQSSQALDQIPVVETTMDAASLFAHGLPHYAEEVLAALLPIVGIFLIFQLFTRKFHLHQMIRISLGLIYAYAGLVMFLTGVNVGFMPAGQLIGSAMAGGEQPWLLVPIGMLIGYFIVKAEPAVQVLTRQVEEISNGSISQKSIQLALSAGVALSVGLAMLRILTGMSILWFLVPGYLLSLVMTFFAPEIFTGIAFDSGGVASGPMTATFLLPLAMGACEAVGGNMMTDAFGMVAMVAMTPLVTIQLLGLASKIRQHLERRNVPAFAEGVEDGILYFD